MIAYVGIMFIVRDPPASNVEAVWFGTATSMLPFALRGPGGKYHAEKVYARRWGKPAHSAPDCLGPCSRASAWRERAPG